MNNPFKTTVDSGIGVVPPPPTHAFGRSLNHVQPFLGAALNNFTLIAPLLFVAAVILTVLAVMQTSAFISAFTRESKASATNAVSPLIDKKALGPADYQSAANIIAKINSAVLVTLPADRSSISISVKDPSLLPEFVYALVTIQSYRTGVAWSAKQICLSKCESGNAASAELTGYTQAISFSGLSTK